LFDLEVSSGSSCTLALDANATDIEVSSGSTAQLEISESIVGEESSGSTLKSSGNPSKVVSVKDISSNVSKR